MGAWGPQTAPIGGPGGNAHGGGQGAKPPEAEALTITFLFEWTVLFLGADIFFSNGNPRIHGQFPSLNAVKNHAAMPYYNEITDKTINADNIKQI